MRKAIGWIILIAAFGLVFTMIATAMGIQGALLTILGAFVLTALLVLAVNLINE